MIRIRDGTPDHSKSSLCASCRCSQIVRGESLDESIVLCHNRGNNPTHVSMHVIECSDYEDKRLPPLWEMQKIAWRITADKRNGAIGFLNPKQFRDKYPDDHDD